MGGFRCSYRNCNLSASTDEKIRYFHFPIKDRKRCEQWIINAQKAHFHTLPIEKLRNKVVCQFHFEPKCFTNERHDRLTFCAIPTLDPTEIKLNLSDVQVVPIETTQNDSFAVVTPKSETLKNPPKQSLSNTLDLTKTSTLDELSLIPVSRDKCTFRISSSPPVKKVKLNVKNIVTPFPRIPKNEVELSHENYDEYATIVPMESDESNNFTYTVTENGELNLISNQTRSKMPLSGNNIKLEQLSGDSYSICIDSDETNEKRVDFEFVAFDENADEEVSKKKTQYITPKKLSTLLATETTETEQTSKSNEVKCKRNSRREIIFKHLSKEINPVLAAALKMELFRKSDWDDSEKQLAMSLYNSTPEGYKCLVEQWGFKLPPEDFVKKWLEQDGGGEEQNGDQDLMTKQEV